MDDAIVEVANGGLAFRCEREAAVYVVELAQHVELGGSKDGCPDRIAQVDAMALVPE